MSVKTDLRRQLIEKYNNTCQKCQKQFRKVQLHHIVYKGQREALPDFSSQLVVRAIGVVSDSYKVKRNRNQRNYFKKTAAVVYDDRVITFRDSGTVNIWTNDGRIEIPIQVYDKEKFKYRKGQVDLVYQNGKFFLLCTLELPVQEKYDALGVIGVDLGVNNIAVTSQGYVFSGEAIEKKRKQYHNHRRRLQMRGTHSAKRRMKTSGQKESRFRKDVNHVISKLLVSKAEGTQSALILEDLTGINSRVTVRHKTKKDRQNANARMSWAFAQLRGYIQYKAELKGVPVILVPSPYTSQRCSECGHTEKKNRKNRDNFLCVSCRHAECADFNASKNIAYLGEQSISLLLAPKALVASHTLYACGS